MLTTIQINGEAREVDASTVSELLRFLELASDRVALEQNREIVPRSAWDATPVREGDRFEIVHFVGGG